ncbi:MAG: beta-glucosidase [Mycobacterium sp.]|nr:beta-glucosidase [Mycobacterium sp.]
MSFSNSSSAFSRSVERRRRLERLVEELVAELTFAEKLGLLDGDLPFWDGLADMLGNGYNRTPIPMGCVERLGIPGFLFTDGPRGVAMGHSTAFPVCMARSDVGS